MKKYFTLLIVMLAIQQISAATFYDQLCQFNFNWKKYRHKIAMEDAKDFKSDKEFIQSHLNSVLIVLRTNPVGHLSKKQYESRKHLIQVLDAYRLTGNFPINYYRTERIPVFIDEKNTHCAVAYLMQQTGNEAMAYRIATSNNYAWVKDIREEGVLQWQQASGFSLEELKLIQGAYEFYMPDAFVQVNKYEIPQKPVCITAYFKSPNLRIDLPKTELNIWCRGEGENGVLNGRWEQNYAIGIPWIVGYFEKGKRSGQWEEYYQGTKILCRTENWKDDKLNGIRKRFDKSGKIIEEILFKDGQAISKTNYDEHSSLKWVRKPMESNLVSTEVFSTRGKLIASGQELVYNPGNLLWFQNIELTALNSIAVSARSIDQSNSSNNINLSNFLGSGNGMKLYSEPALVEYKKQGNWTYYKEFNGHSEAIELQNSKVGLFSKLYPHFGFVLYNGTSKLEGLEINSDYDSIHVNYSDDRIQSFKGYEASKIEFNDSHSKKLYNNENRSKKINTSPTDSRVNNAVIQRKPKVVVEIGPYNEQKQRTLVRKYFNEKGELYKTENVIIPRKEEEENGAKK